MGGWEGKARREGENERDIGRERGGGGEEGVKR